METQKQTMPEGYTGLYKQTVLVPKRDVNTALYSLEFSQYMKSKGALRVFSGGRDTLNERGKMKNEVYFHPEFSAYVEYDSSKNKSADLGIEITQPVDSTSLILEDIIKNFPELRKLKLSPKKIGVRDPLTEAHCF